MLILYIIKSLKTEVIGLIYESNSRFYAAAFFHKLPILKYKVTKCYGDLWIIYKFAFVFLLYYDMKQYIIILALINPLSMVGMDCFQFYRLWRYYRINFDKVYFCMHIFADLILLLNGMFLFLVEYSSEATSNSQLVNKFD